MVETPSPSRNAGPRWKCAPSKWIFFWEHTRPRVLQRTPRPLLCEGGNLRREARRSAPEAGALPIFLCRFAALRLGFGNSFVWFVYLAVKRLCRDVAAELAAIEVDCFHGGVGGGLGALQILRPGCYS